MIIGIDPDLVKSGLAVVQGGRISSLHAMTLFELVKFIDYHKKCAEFVLENVEYDKVTYPRKGLTKAAMLKVAQNVGMAKFGRPAKLTEAKKAEIRERASDINVSKKALLKEFNISRSTLYRVLDNVGV
ncbi:MAG: helix-turn-helix domain-containing protein [Amphritea sp.]